MAGPVTERSDCVVLHVHVVPRASRTKAVGLHGDRLKLQVAAPPVDGEANDAIVRFLAKTLGIARDDVTLVSGATGRQKSFELAGITATEVTTALGLA